MYIWEIYERNKVFKNYCKYKRLVYKVNDYRIRTWVFKKWLKSQEIARVASGDFVNENKKGEE